MPYEILYNSWLICCTIIGRLFCKRKDDHDLAGPSKNDTRAQVNIFLANREAVLTSFDFVSQPIL